MAMTPEARVKAAVKKFLTARGAYFYMPMSNGLGRVGAPDFMVCYEGRFIGIETKAPGKRSNTTPNQDRELSAIHQAGGVAVVIDDVSQLDNVFTD
jgi:hypothetical protein